MVIAVTVAIVYYLTPTLTHTIKSILLTIRVGIAYVIMLGEIIGNYAITWFKLCRVRGYPYR